MCKLRNAPGLKPFRNDNTCNRGLSHGPGKRFGDGGGTDPRLALGQGEAGLAKRDER
jgi:hypothetical protein